MLSEAVDQEKRGRPENPTTLRLVVRYSPRSICPKFLGKTLNPESQIVVRHLNLNFLYMHLFFFLYSKPVILIRWFHKHPHVFIHLFKKQKPEKNVYRSKRLILPYNLTWFLAWLIACWECLSQHLSPKRWKCFTVCWWKHKGSFWILLTNNLFCCGGVGT